MFSLMILIIQTLFDFYALSFSNELNLLDAVLESPLIITNL